MPVAEPAEAVRASLMSVVERVAAMRRVEAPAARAQGMEQEEEGGEALERAPGV